MPVTLRLHMHRLGLREQAGGRGQMYDERWMCGLEGSGGRGAGDAADAALGVEDRKGSIVADAVWGAEESNAEALGRHGRAPATCSGALSAAAPLHDRPCIGAPAPQGTAP
eukprot:355417-Chlamydomonas_euryale.AAC.4